MIFKHLFNHIVTYSSFFSNRANEHGKLFEWSRYSNEFLELEFIARGGFGEVVKVQNKLDASVYAIKKICLKYAQCFWFNAV